MSLLIAVSGTTLRRGAGWCGVMELTLSPTLDNGVYSIAKGIVHERSRLVKSRQAGKRSQFVLDFANKMGYNTIITTTLGKE